MENKLTELIKKSSTIADIDEALIPIQDALGVAGDYASIYFSGWQDGEWEGLNECERKSTLEDYVEGESLSVFEEEEGEEDCDDQSTLIQTKCMKPDVDIYIQHAGNGKSFLVHEWSDVDESSTLISSHTDLHEAMRSAVLHAFSWEK